jgi:histidine triad (HIT) family protein
MSDCIFCKIVKGEIPSAKVYSDEQATAFRDINPVAPTHILIIPNKHIASINDMEEGDEQLMGRLLLVAKKIAAQEGIANDGYRLIVNTGAHAGQVVFHVHVHIIGGARLKHPMG